MKAANRLAVFLGVVVACAALTVTIAPRPIPQDQQYHHFADSRSFVGVPNFFNVASNIIFVLAGLAGFAAFPQMRSGMAPGEPFMPALMLCVGAVLTGAGSAIYHWNPWDKSLVFDRMGIAIVCAAFIALLATHFGIPWVHAVFLLALGLGSVLFWVRFGDLRPYGVFQGLPIVLFAVGTVFFPRTHTGHATMCLVTGGYVLAKICEVLDQQIYRIGGIVSGHTLKHLIAGASLWITVAWLRDRRPVVRPAYVGKRLNMNVPPL